MKGERGVSGGVIFQGPIPYAKWLNDHAAVAPGTAKAYAKTMNAMLGKDRTLDTNRIAKFCKRRNRHYVRAALSKYLDYLVYSKEITEDRKKDILDAVPKVKEVPTKPRTLVSLDDMRNVLELMDPDDRLVARFLFYTGCRIGEALSLKVSDIDFKTGMVTVYGKGRIQKTPRAVMLSAGYRQEVKSYSGKMGILDGEPIFYPDNKGTLETRITKFNERFGRACMTVLGKTLGSHEFRRLAGTTLYENTHDLQLVKNQLGHSNLDTTLIYTQYADKKINLDKARDILGNIDLTGKKESKRVG